MVPEMGGNKTRFPVSCAALPLCARSDSSLFHLRDASETLQRFRAVLQMLQHQFSEIVFPR